MQKSHRCPCSGSHVSPQGLLPPPSTERLFAQRTAPWAPGHTQRAALPCVPNHPALRGQHRRGTMAPGSRALGSLGSLGCGPRRQLPGCEPAPAPPAFSLPGAAAGGCRPGTPRLPPRHQTQAPTRRPKGNLPTNWNAHHHQQKQQQNIQKPLVTVKPDTTSGSFPALQAPAQALWLLPCAARQAQLSAPPRRPGQPEVGS